MAVAYADCGTYGRLDQVCDRLGTERLPGLHCYDLIAGNAVIERLFEEEPGTYLLTDFLVAGFRRLVIEELGLDRRPELVADYFGHYSRVVWLTERPGGDLREKALSIASLLGLELVVVKVGREILGLALSRLLEAAQR